MFEFFFGNFGIPIVLSIWFCFVLIGSHVQARSSVIIFNVYMTIYDINPMSELVTISHLSKGEKEFPAKT